MGLSVKPEEIHKPEALVLYEMCNQMGIPMFEGGIEDQPYIWLEEYRICSEEVTLHMVTNAQNDAAALKQKMDRLTKVKMSEA